MPVTVNQYQPAIPLSTDQLSKSQSDLFNNFGAIQLLVDQDHTDFATGTGNAGKHFRVSLPIQGSNPGFVLPDLGIYASTFFVGASMSNEIFISNNASKQIPFTNSGTGIVSGNAQFSNISPLVI